MARLSKKCTLIATLTLMLHSAAATRAMVSSAEAISLRSLPLKDHRKIQWRRRVVPEASFRIIGGKDAMDGRYPYMAALIDKNGDFFCGGTLIEKNMVLTAAHCKGAKHVVIGRTSFVDDMDEEMIKVDKEYRHPDYDKKTVEYDVMILKLAKKIKDVKPIEINLKGNDDPDDDDPLTVVGWGSLDRKGRKYPTDLQELELNYVDECEELFAEGEITSDMMCAGKKKKDTCFGDSGGPLIIKRNGPGNDVQVGIVSWGYGCAYKDFPGVYAKLSDKKISKFVRKHM